MSVEGLNLTHLTETERDAIMEVIHRDESLQKADDSRVRKLRAEINQIRMKGVIKPGIDPNRTCARCREPLGLLFNRGDLCHKCHSKVCNKCKVNQKDDTWLCVLCSKQQELEVMSGGWFYSKFRKSKRHRKTNKVISGSEIIRASIKHPSLGNRRGYCNKRTATTDVKMALMRNTPPRHLMNNHNYTDTDSSGSQEGTRAKRKNKIPTGENVMSPNVSDELRLKQLVGTKPAYTRNGREPIQVRRVQGRPPFVTESSSSSDEEYEKSVPYKVNHVTPSAERNTNQQKTANHRKVYPSDTELNSPQSSATESTHNNKPSYSQEANYLHTAAATYSSVDSQQSDSYHSGKFSSGSSNQSSIESASSVSEAFRLHQYGGGDPRNRRLASDSSSRQTSVESHSSAHNGASSPMRARSPQPIDANVIISKPQPVEEDTIMPVVASRSREIDVEKLNSLEYSSSNDDSEFTSRHNRRNRREPEHKSNPAAIHRTNGEYNQDMTPNRVRKKGLGHKQVTNANRTQNGIKQNGTARVGVQDEPKGVQGEEDVIVEELSQVKFRRCSSHKTVVTRRWSGAVNGETTTPIIIVTPEEEADQREAADNVSRSSLSNGMSPENTLNRRGRARKHVTVKDPRDQEVYDANPEPVAEQPPVQEPPVQEPPPKPKRSPDRTSVELPAVTVSSNKETGEDLDEQLAAEEEDSIDDLVENHRRSFASHDSHGSNLLSPFSDSRESITSFYSDAGEGNYGKIPVTGEIQFSLDYVYKTGLFEVRIKQCKDLAPVDTKRNRSDPYVKTYLLPDKSRSGKRKTRVKKHTLNPTFDEALRYAVAESELRSRTLWVTVWHNDTFGRNDFLGEVTIPLDYYKFGDNSPRWYPLKERNPVPASLLTYKGDLIVSLKFVTPDQVVSKNKTSKGALYVVIKEARNLTAVRTNGSSDPFCKGYLLPDKSKNAKQKTPVMKKDCNPKWDHTFNFEDVTQEELKARSLELTIWDHDRFTSNDFLGGVRLNLGTGLDQGNSVEWMDARGEEISIWQSMLDRPNCWIDGTLLLRTNMDQRK